MIPTFLQNNKHYFVKIQNGKKIPIGAAWEITPEEWEQQEDKTWKNKTTGEIKQVRGISFAGIPSNFKYEEIKNYSGRIGLLLGPTNLIDVELEGTKDGKINKHFAELETICETLPKTTTIKTPSGGKRRIYNCPELKTNYELRHYSCSPEEQEAEFRGNGQSLISGTGYKLIHDEPIATITLEQLKKVFYDYLNHERQKTINTESNKIEIPITNVLSTSQYTPRGGGEYQGTHPSHGSKTGWNFAFNTNTNTWFCHHVGHENGGGTLDLIAVIEGIIDCSEAKNGLRGEKFLATLEAAKNKYGYNLEPKKETATLTTLDKNQIATNEEYQFENKLPADHYVSHFISKVADISDTYPEYAYANALNQLSMIADRTITLEITPKTTQLNLWVILLGQSTISRKTAALDQNKLVLEVAGLNHKLGVDDSSPEAFIMDLQNRPQQNLLLDEFGAFLSRTNKKYMNEIPSLLCALYDSPNEYNRMLRKEEFRVSHPYITLLGATTPETFQATTTENDFTSGFFYRCLFLYPERKKARKRITNLPETDWEKTKELAQWLADIYKFIQETKKQKINVKMQFENSALDEHDKWCAQYETYFSESESGKEMQSFFGRMQINALKVAALLYLGSGEMKSNIAKLGASGNDFNTFNTFNTLTKLTKNSDEKCITENLKETDNISIVKNVNYVNIANSANLLTITIPSFYVRIAIYYASKLFLPYSAKALRLVQTISGADIERVHRLAVENAKSGVIEHSALLQRSHLKSKDFKEIISTLQETGRIYVSTNKNGKIVYTPLKSEIDSQVKPPEVELL